MYCPSISNAVFPPTSNTVPLPSIATSPQFRPFTFIFVSPLAHPSSRAAYSAAFFASSVPIPPSTSVRPSVDRTRSTPPVGASLHRTSRTFPASISVFFCSPAPAAARNRAPIALLSVNSPCVPLPRPSARAATVNSALISPSRSASRSRVSIAPRVASKLFRDAF